MILEPIAPDEDRSKEIYSSLDCQNLFNMWEEYYPQIGFNPPWVGYFIKEDHTVLGSCAFAGKPENNRAEISYWTFAEFEGSGIATWCCSELVSIAKKENAAIMITAKTLPERNASTTVLEKNGFVFSGIVQDHEIGDAWEWTLI